jgi:hypothetical protein
MFYGCVRALGKVTLIKREDGTECSAQDPTSLAIPDYRVVTDEGTQYLVEVKNWHKSYEQPFTVGKSWMESWRKYAKTTRSLFRIAVYFSRYKYWALLSPKAFKLVGERYAISFVDAMKRSEMSMLGDVMVGTKCPLAIKIRIERDVAHERDGEDIKGRIADVGFYCEDRRIIDPAEQRIASLLIIHGGWQEHESANLTDPTAVTMTYEFKPEQQVEHQGFQMCDFLSRMFSRWYIGVTGPEAEQPTQIYARQDPVAFEKLIPEGYKGKDLPLWLFQMRPNFGQ